MSFQLKLLEGQITAPLKDFCPFVPLVPSLALHGSRSVPGRGPGTGPDWQRSVRSSTTRPAEALGPDTHALRSVARAKIPVQTQTPACPSKEGPLTLSSLQRQRQGRREALRKTPKGRKECAPSNGKDRCRANEREAERGAGLAGETRGRGRERQAPGRERTRPPRGGRDV